MSHAENVGTALLWASVFLNMNEHSGQPQRILKWRRATDQRLVCETSPWEVWCWSYGLLLAYPHTLFSIPVVSMAVLEAWVKHVRQIQPNCRAIGCTLYKRELDFTASRLVTAGQPGHQATGPPRWQPGAACQGKRNLMQHIMACHLRVVWALEEERQANEGSRCSLAILVCATKHSSSASVGACALQCSPPTAAGLKAPFPGTSLYLWMASSTNIYHEYAQNKPQVTGKKW